MTISNTVKKIIFICCLFFVITPWCSATYALLIGILVAIIPENPFVEKTNKWGSVLLKISIVGIGFGINLNDAVEIGTTGLLFTIGSVGLTILLAAIAGKILKIENKISYLISAGSAICGGTAIAAVSPIIKADQRQISVAMGIVFILNAVALFIFPFIGEYLNLTQDQFGYWCGIAIHDTSSVVGAASIYGKEALITATTVKLGRTLWIIPAVFITSLIFKNPDSKKKFPFFILFFIIAIIISSYLPFIQNYTEQLVFIAKKGFTITLFFIGAGLSKKLIKSVGWRPFAQGAIVWMIISIVALYAIMIMIK